MIGFSYYNYNITLLMLLVYIRLVQFFMNICRTKEYKQVQVVAEQKKKEFDGNVDFQSLLKENEDVKAWLYSENTVINYPIVQGEDNQFYLYRMINKQWNGKGSLFIDFRNEKPFEDFNTVVYGHRMKDGSMFHSLVDYRDKKYFNKHKKTMLITPEHKYDLYIFGVVTIPADSDKYKFSFSGQSEKQEYLDWIKENSEIDTCVLATPEDNIVMLSTCTYEFDDARLVVYGKLVEVEED